MAKHILLCDDEPHILRAAEFKLKKSGYNVTLASDGQEGWERVQESTPDIVITDCQMPRMDGLGLAKTIKESGKYDGLPVLMLTAKGYELSAETIRDEYGILDVLSKPFSPRELQKRVEEVIGVPEEATV